MSHATLRLVEMGDPNSLPFDRRHDARHAVSGRVTAMQSERVADDHARNRICSLQLLNMSGSGMAAIVQEPIEINATIAVYFAPHGPERGMDLHGHVVRCTAHDGGHEVAIHFDARSAA